MRACRTGTALRARSMCAWRWRRKAMRRTATQRSWTSPGAPAPQYIQSKCINGQWNWRTSDSLRHNQCHHVDLCWKPWFTGRCS